MKLVKHLIGGREHGAASQRTGKVFNPATGEQTTGVVFATSEDVQLAVAARDAYVDWRVT